MMNLVYYQPWSLMESLAPRDRRIIHREFGRITPRCKQ